MEQLTEALAAKAKQLGGVIQGVDFEGKNKIPSDKEMSHAIERLRLAYLAALFCKNFHLFVEAADRGDLGMVHVRKDETRIGKSFARKWEYVVRKDYVDLPCNETIAPKCLTVRVDMDVLEWKAPGHDREGEYQSTGFPSKWNDMVWRLPMSVKVLPEIVWGDSKVKVSPYADFHRLFFTSACYGSGDGKGGFWDGVYPRVWDSFGLDANRWQRKFPLGRVRWDSRTVVTKIGFSLVEDEKQLTEPKDIVEKGKKGK